LELRNQNTLPKIGDQKSKCIPNKLESIYQNVFPTNMSLKIEIYFQQIGAQDSEYIPNKFKLRNQNTYIPKKFELRNQNIFPTNWSTEIKIYSQKTGARNKNIFPTNWSSGLRIYSKPARNSLLSALMKFFNCDLSIRQMH
jgi:hypothetical protein